MKQTHEIDSIFSKSFFLSDVNGGKVSRLLDKANAIREFKNTVSQRIFDDVFHYLDGGKFSAMTEFKSNSRYLNGQDEQNAIQDVYDTYTNKFDTLNQKIQFSIIYVKPTYYKRNGKALDNGRLAYHQGQFKSFSIKRAQTPLCLVLTFLARYGSDNTITYIQGKLQIEENKDKIKFYESVLSYISKFGFERLMRVALMKRDMVKNKLFIEPHRFESLNFRTVSRVKDDIVALNKNGKSVVRAFINIGGFLKDELTDEQWADICQQNEARRSEGKPSLKSRTDVISLPVKLNKKYHGDLNNYLKDVASYTVCFESNRKIRVVLTKKDKRQVVSGSNGILGVDVNIKHNMFSTSGRDAIDYDRKLINKFIGFIKHTNGKKVQKHSMGLDKSEVNRMSSKDKSIQDYYIRAITYDIQYKSHLLVKNSIEKGYDHIVMEDLSKMSRGFSKSDEFDGVKYTKLWNLFHIPTINDVVRNLCYTSGVTFSLVHPEYTSKQCPVCGTIDDGNRTSQENFECVVCGHQDGADFNSAVNIKHRVVSDVLREKLLKKSAYGELTPKRMDRASVKEVLLNYYSENLKDSSGDGMADVLGCHYFS